VPERKQGTLSPKCKMHVLQELKAVKEAHQDGEAGIYVLMPGRTTE